MAGGWKEVNDWMKALDRVRWRRERIFGEFRRRELRGAIARSGASSDPPFDPNAMIHLSYCCPISTLPVQFTLHGRLGTSLYCYSIACLEHFSLRSQL